VDTHHVQPTKVQYYSPLVLALLKNTKTMFLLHYCILLIPFLFTVKLSSLLFAFNTFLTRDYSLASAFSIFISSLYLILIYLIYFAYRSSIFYILSYYFTSCSCDIFSICFYKVLNICERILALHCVTCISFYKSSYYFLLIKSTSFLLGRQVGPCTPDHACL